MGQYFNKDTDRSIERYLSSTDLREKNRIFELEISPAFEKLIENQIFVYRFFKVDDVDTLKREALSNLYEMLPKFDPSKGTKGFSYFNVVARNWFIHKVKEKSKKNRIESELHVDVDHESNNSDPNFSINPYEHDIEEKERWNIFCKALESWKPRLAKSAEKQVLNAVIYLLNNPDLVTIYNKKAVYLYLRELTNLNTKQVVTHLKKLKSFYNEWSEEYNSTGHYGGFEDGEERESGFYR